MDKIRVIGGKKLNGQIAISGAKNAALPLMAASLLTDEALSLSNVPHLADVSTMANLLSSLGVAIGLDGHATTQGGHLGRVLRLSAKTLTTCRADYELVRKMRASVLVLGPLVARFGKAEVSLPGGCAIGTRPVDLHLQAMEALGAKIELSNGYILAEAPQGLKGAEISFPFVSVGATENAVMAASLAVGKTVIHNAAREPEIVDLCHCLIRMGARIQGIRSGTLVIEGVPKLSAAEHQILPDRIEAGTYAIAAAMAGGDLELLGARADDLSALLQKLEQAGIHVLRSNTGIRVSRHDTPIRAVSVETEAFPGFPTDLQAQFMTLMTKAEGESVVSETIFENRFMHVPELARMGADIRVEGGKATVHGVAKLNGAPVMATDLRASVSLILAGLAAEGETIVSRVYHLDRGYERLEEKLSACGANIERIRE